MATKKENDSHAPRDLRLKEIPFDVISEIYDMQNSMKKTAGRHVSIEKAFIRIVRNYRELIAKLKE